MRALQQVVWLLGLLAVAGIVESSHLTSSHSYEFKSKAKLQQSCPQALQDGRGVWGLLSHISSSTTGQTARALPPVLQHLRCTCAKPACIIYTGTNALHGAVQQSMKAHHSMHIPLLQNLECHCQPCTPHCNPLATNSSRTI
jgi:hypothetical protein